MAIVSGKLVFNTAKQPTRLSDEPLVVRELWIQATETNGDDVYIGGPNVNAASVNSGYRLQAKDRFPPDGPWLDIDLNEVWVAAETAGNAINWIARI